MKFSNEIDRNAPITKTEKAALGMFLMWPLIFVLALTSIVGCKESDAFGNSDESCASGSEVFPSVEKWWK